MKPYLFICWLVISQAATSQNNKLIHFTPLSFTNKFSLNVEPVLTIKSGDTVSTETVDAAGAEVEPGGTDEVRVDGVVAASAGGAVS